MVLSEKSSQEYPVNVGVPQGFVLGPTLLLIYINDSPDNFICNLTIYADDTTLCSKCDQASDNIAVYVDDTTLYSKYDQTSDLWKQLELASELESDL